MIKIIKLILILTVITGINACKKEGSISDVKNLGVGSYLTLDQKVNDILDATLPSSTVSIKVTEKGSAVDKIKIYVSVGTKTQNKALWKFIKEVPYSAGVTLVVSNAEIKTAIGANVVPGVTYWLYNELIQKDGGVHSFANTFNEYESNPNYNMALTWRAISVCPFTAAAAAGTYTITVVGFIVSVTGASPGLAAYGKSKLTTAELAVAVTDRKSTRLNSSHSRRSRMPSSA